jgi:hypothetical protein
MQTINGLTLAVDLYTRYILNRNVRTRPSTDQDPQTFCGR